MQPKQSGRYYLDGNAPDGIDILFPVYTIPTIALSINYGDFERTSRWATANGFAIEYTPDPCDLELMGRHIGSLNPHVPLRYHCRFPRFEIGAADVGLAEEALKLHLRVLKAVRAVGGSCVTVHLNLNRQIPFDASIGLKNLTTLVYYARQLGLTVCLENLKHGMASDPRNVLKWANSSKAMITLDIGHAVSCELVKEGGMRVRDFVDMFSARLYEIHIYGKEEERHHPLRDITPLEPALELALASGCTWWTIELEDHQEIMHTRSIIKTYFDKVTCRYVDNPDTGGGHRKESS